MSENNNYLLLEGKRDNQLLPYLQAFNEKSGKELSLGEFKSMMLRKLSSEGNIHNVSLQSNYYLVGAIKYYFQGLLTNGGELGVFTGTEDNWNLKVCQQLNAVILVLRNGYIDSIGTTWVEPEDFGTLKLKDLFTKYKKEIKKILTQTKPSTAKEEEAFEDYVMNNPEYTYDIIYNYTDATRYNQATSPGAWCITYGAGHLNYYTSQGNGHFVIFAKKGYESIPRKVQKEMWKGDKPQDEYGNSLIAYLQSNTGPGPADYNGGPLITSRWNHGYNGVSCEADRAYTQEEFEQITGVNNADLKGIYETWLHNKDKSRESKTLASCFKIKPEQLRVLKYAQMKINGGEKPENLMHGYVPSVLINICTMEVAPGLSSEFVVVGKNIIFETAIIDFEGSRQIQLKQNDNDEAIAIFKYDFNDKCFIINKRTKSLVNIGGFYLFKAVNFGRFKNSRYLKEIKMSNTDIALINPATGIPVKLPNGQYWFNEIFGYRETSKKHGEVVSANISMDGFYEIIYDSSSGEKYFLDARHNRFVDLGQNDGKCLIFLKDMLSNCDTQAIIECPLGSNYRTQYGYVPYNRLNYCKQLLFSNGKPVDFVFELNGVKYKIGDNGPEDATKISFTKMTEVGNGIVKVILELSRSEWGILLDFNKKDIIQSPTNENTPYFINFMKINNYGFIEVRNNVLKVGVETDTYYSDRNFAYLYDLRTGKYLKNPYKYPSDMIFAVSEITYDTDAIIFFINTYPSYYSEENNGNRLYANWDEYFHNVYKHKRYLDTKTLKFYKFKSNARGRYNSESIEPEDNFEIFQNQAINEQDIVKMVNKVISVISEYYNRKKLK